MTGLFDRGEVNITCPKCDHKYKKTIGWLKANDHILCVCGVDIRFDKSKFTAPLQEVDKAFDDMKRKLRGFGK